MNMGIQSALTHEFRRGKVDHDGSCFYSSFRYVDGVSSSICNLRVRSSVATYILNHENLHLQALTSGVKCKTIKEYCTKIEKHNLPGGKAERRALAMLSLTVIYVISIRKTTQGKYAVNILNYGEDIESFEKCVYILYDEENKHYEPLYVVNKQDSNEIVTLFQRNHGVILQLLDKFIQKEFGDNVDMQSNCHSRPCENELLTESIVLNEIAQISDMIVPQSSTNLSCRQNINSIVWDPTNDKQLPISVSASNKRIKLGEPNINESSAHNENNLESASIDELLVTDDSSNASVSSKNQLTTTTHMPTASTKYQIEQMRFEIEPAQKFRGRTKHEYKPKKELKRNGQRSTARLPRHFADRNDNNVLNLLIPKEYLKPDAEYRLEICLVTEEIEGCTYINLRFKFQVHRTDKEIPDENPISVPFDIAQLKDYSEGIKQLQLRLVVIMHTNPELMKIKQPLPIFSGLNNESAITTTYDSHSEFKNAYHLDNLRFAITLYEKKFGEIEFHRCDDIQYISEISTEDRKYKKKNRVVK